MEKTFRHYNQRQMLLLPPSPDDWLPEDHLARFISETVDSLDISGILADYEKDLRGYPPYHPLMMLKILIYGYATGVRSSRKIARKCVEDVAFRYLAANNFPKFEAIADFRLRHLESFKKLFLQVLLLCKEAGPANLGHVALDGTKIKATDPESRIMPNPADKKSLIQGYNAQAAVNENQVIVATGLNNEVSDCRQLPRMIAEIRANNDDLPDDFTSDAGYFSHGNVLLLRETLKVNALIPLDKERHGKRSEPAKGPPGKKAGLSEKMRWLLSTEIGKSTYALRKALVEPVIGRIKTCQNFDRFLLRGQEKALGEWNLACLCHNLGKLFQFGMSQA